VAPDTTPPQPGVAVKRTASIDSPQEAKRARHTSGPVSYTE